jgi:predicted RNase H-like nuclease
MLGGWELESNWESTPTATHTHTPMPMAMLAPTLMPIGRGGKKHKEDLGHREVRSTGRLGGCYPAEKNQECADIEAYIRTVDP